MNGIIPLLLRKKIEPQSVTFPSNFPGGNFPCGNSPRIHSVSHLKTTDGGCSDTAAIPTCTTLSVQTLSALIDEIFKRLRKFGPTNILGRRKFGPTNILGRRIFWGRQFLGATIIGGDNFLGPFNLDHCLSASNKYMMLKFRGPIINYIYGMKVKGARLKCGNAFAFDPPPPCSISENNH